MRLVKDHSPGAYAVQVRCCSCHQMRWLSEVAADLDGRAFLDYYCKACTPLPKGKCNRDGCLREECQ